MAKKSIFIPFPWSTDFENGIYFTSSQAKEAHNIIISALQYKYFYHQLIRQRNKADAEKYNLSNARIFNLFVSEITKKLFNRDTRKYVLDCVKKIRDIKVKNENIFSSFEILYNFFCRKKDSLKKQMFEQFLMDNMEVIIDFMEIFKLVETGVLVKDNDCLKEISDTFNKYCKEELDDVKV